ncbi:GEVED domain-containing protein [Chryseobacterium sp. T1]
MKKLLLSCCLALGIGANAQINYIGDFEEGYNTTLYGQFGGGSRTTAAACSGTYGGQLAVTNANTGYMVVLNEITGQTNNGQQVTASVNYKKGAGAVGKLNIAYFVKDESGAWAITNFGPTVDLATDAITTCATLTATLPSGMLQPNKTNAIGVWFTRVSGSGNIFVDNISIAQDNPTTVPPCTTFTSPVNASTISGGNSLFTWPAVATAVNYKVMVGTTSGGTDVLNKVVSGNSLNVSLPTDKTLFAKVVPTNLNGDATGCSEISFSTTSTIAYCGPLTSNQAAAVAPIKSVSFAGVTHTSDASVTTIGSFSPYEDFSNVKFSFVRGIASIPLTVKGTTNGGANNGWAMSVFIDWNNDGDFDDAGEAYFNTTASMIRITGVTDNPVTLVGNIAIPAGVSIGNKKMRIKYNFSGVAIHDALVSGCSQMGNGQAEDYTIEIIADPTTVPSCANFTSPADAATGVSPVSTLTWDFVNNATSYKVYIGTTAGGTDIADGVVVSGTSYNATLAANTKYFAKVVANNAIGDAEGCSEISFTTGNVLYCAAKATSTSFEKISRVQFANIDNSSTSTAGYENFSHIVGTVERSKNYQMTVSISQFDTDKTTVWIDYNQDGVFSNDEKISLTATNLATGSITIPATAKLGKTGMRVRTNYNVEGPACGDTTYGQVEDYTLDINVYQAVSDINKANVSVYPNPFKDVLKISDVKDAKSISVVDASGRVVATPKVSQELNLSNLGKGMYFVTVSYENGSTKSFKVIKE